MNIIFLDVDGVLNSVNYLMKIYKKTNKPHSGYSYPFDPDCLNNLEELIKETNSNLVITSTWRKSKEGKEKLLNKLQEYDLDKLIIGYTPVLNSSKEDEIQEYIINHNFDSTTNFVILDDCHDMGELSPNLVSTNSQVGLTKKDVEKAINILNKTINIDNHEIER